MSESSINNAINPWLNQIYERVKFDRLIGHWTTKLGNFGSRITIGLFVKELGCVNRFYRAVPISKWQEHWLN